MRQRKLALRAHAARSAAHRRKADETLLRPIAAPGATSSDLDLAATDDGPSELRHAAHRMVATLALHRARSSTGVRACDRLRRAAPGSARAAAEGYCHGSRPSPPAIALR